MYFVRSFRPRRYSIACDQGHMGRVADHRFFFNTYQERPVFSFI